ncbi:uncharacterized protein METZ01_LOCUS459192, partial [marine metagenome]
TQVTGTFVSPYTSIENDFLSGQPYGNRNVYVALLDQNGDLHNPPITQSVWVNYQSDGGGYQSPTGDSITITSPSNGANADQHADLQVSVTYQSSGGGYQTPTWAYRIGSGFPGYGSPHGGTQITGSTTANDFLGGQSDGSRTVYVALLDQAGMLHNPPITQSVWVNYQSGGGGYQSPTGDYIVIDSPSNGANADQHADLEVSVTYQSGGGGYQTPTWAYRIDSGFPGYGSPHGGTQVVGVEQANDFLSGQA